MLQNPPASLAFAGGAKYIGNDGGGDDEDFGDFVFSSPSSTSHAPTLFSYPTPLIHFTAGGEDDWGDFVTGGSGSQFVEHQTTIPSVLPFDPSQDEFPCGSLLSEPPACGKAIEKPKGPLPLSIFGEEDLDETEPSEGVGGFANGFDPPSFANHSFPSAHAARDLKDLINSLYGQACDVRNGAMAGSQVKEEKDDFDEGGWEFKDAFSADSGTKSDEVSEDITGLGLEAAAEESTASQIVVNRLETGWNDFVCFETNGQEGGHTAASTDPEEPAMMSHGQSRSVSSMYVHDLVSCFDNGNVSIVKNEFKTEFRENAIANGSEEAVPDDQAEVLHLPGKNVAEDVSNGSLKLFASPSVQQILQSASREHQLLYINAWCKLAQFCAKELQHGAKIWREALEDDICIELLSKGSKYFLALGEIYRVSRILKASASFYMPWLLTDRKDASELISCLEECNKAWTNSGLDKVLSSLCNSDELDDKNLAESLLESIRLIDKVVVPTFDDLAIPLNPSACRFSLLPFGMLPDIKKDVWNGHWYFTKLVNLWANLVASHPPELPW